MVGWLGMAFYFIQRWIYGPLIPSLIQEFHTDRTILGVVGAACLWGYMLTPILAGSLSDRFGRKNTILFGIFGFSVLTAVSGIVGSASQLFASRFFTGMVEPFFFIPLLAFTLELFPERPGFFLTLMTSGSSVGWFVGPAMSGRLLDVTGSWRAPYLITGFAGILVAFLLMVSWPEEKKSLRSGVLFDRGILKRHNLILLLLLSFTATFQIAAEFGFTMWYPAYLKTELGMTATVAGFLAGLYGIGQGVGRPVLGLTADRLGYRRVGVAGGAILLVAMIATLSAPSALLKGLLIFVAGFFGAAVMGSLWTFTGLVFPAFKGLALGVMTTFAYATASLSPIAIGYIGDRQSIAVGLWSICVPCIFLASLSFLLTRFLQRGPAATIDAKTNVQRPMSK